MKTTISVYLIIIASILILPNVEGQLSVEYGTFRKFYYKDGQPIISREFSTLINSNQSSAKEYQKYKSYNSIALPIRLVGQLTTIGIGVYEMYTLIQNRGGGSPYAYVKPLIIGSGIWCLSIPFTLISQSHLKKSIKIYNSTPQSGINSEVEIYFGLTGDGMGFYLSF
ncbi:MAG: hypothetical protein GX660_08795 [Clostridiaceae bacterium]|nr:hypothetical protein [Clostridiaceae bacterium]